MFYWTDVFNIINRFLDTKDTDIAAILDRDKSTVSRYRHGGIPKSSLRKFIENIFITGYQNSPVSKGNKEGPLGLLKYIISDEFEHVYNDMKGCWGETDYKKFVCKLLSRAEKGPSSRIKPKKAESEKTPPEEIASEQMRQIFADAVADYKIALYVCLLPDFLRDGFYMVSDIVDFFEIIGKDLPAKFINFQTEPVYEEIQEFTNALKSHLDRLELIDPHIIEPYGNILEVRKVNATLKYVEEEYSNLESKLNEEKSGDNGANNSSALELDYKLRQLDCLRSVLYSCKHLCESYSKIFPGQTLLVF